MEPRKPKCDEASESQPSPLATADDLLTIEEVASLLRVPRSWIYAHTKRKSRLRLPHVKLGKYVRFSKAAILEFLLKLRREPHA
jgi:excisionase family DNA binding protein